MKYDVKINKELYETYSDIRLGFLRFKAEVKEPEEAFWKYMNEEVCPKVRQEIEEKNGMILLV